MSTIQNRKEHQIKQHHCSSPRLGREFSLRRESLSFRWDLIA